MILAIGMIRHLSVYPSVMRCISVLKVGVGVESCTILFIGWYFSFTSLDTSVM